MTVSTTTTALKFLAKLPVYETEKPYTLYGFHDDVGPKTNCVYSSIDGIPIEDVRGRTEDFRIEECGFEFHDRPSGYDLDAQVFEDPQKQAQVLSYLSETCEVAQNLLGAAKVLCFDWRVSAKSKGAWHVLR
jgi:hypothetical protein